MQQINMSYITIPQKCECAEDFISLFHYFSIYYAIQLYIMKLCIIINMFWQVVIYQ